jgi:hypothetical protein
VGAAVGDVGARVGCFVGVSVGGGVGAADIADGAVVGTAEKAAFVGAGVIAVAVGADDVTAASVGAGDVTASVGDTVH